MDLQDERTIQKFIRCHYHTDKVYTMFCTTCNCLVCSTCILDNHYKQHEFCKISEVLERRNAEFSQLLAKKAKGSEVDLEAPVDDLGNKSEGKSCNTLRQNKNWLKNEMFKNQDEIRSQEKELSTLCDTLFQKINDRTDFLIENLNTERQRLLSKVKNAIMAQMFNENCKEENNEVCLTYLKSLETDPKFVDGLDDVFRLKITDLLLYALDNSGSTDSLDVSTYLTYTCTVSSETDVTVKMQELVGNVTCSMDATEDCVKLEPCAKNTNDEQANQSREMKAVDDHKRTLEIPLGEIRKILPKSENSLFIIGTRRYGYYRSGLYKTEMKMLKEHELICDNVVDICDDVVDLCDGPNQCIYFCKENSSIICLYTKDGIILRFVDCGPKSYARCLDFISTEDQIMACVEKDSEVKAIIFNTAGQCLKVTPCGLYNRNVSRYYHRVTTAGIYPILLLQLNKEYNGCGIVRDANAKTVFVGSIGFEPAEKFFHPTGICVDDQGQILVSDYKNHLVYLLHPDGKFRRSLLSEKDGVVSPSAIALDKKGFLWIGCYNKILIVKYQPDL